MKDAYKMIFDSVTFNGQINFQLSLLANTLYKKVPLLDDRIQPILVWKYFGKAQWGFRIQFRMGPQTFEYLLGHDSYRHRKNGHIN